MSNTFSHGYALLIGVGECAYANLSLPVTVKDMQALRSVLTNSAICGYPDDSAHIRLLHDANATRGAILDGLSWLAEQTSIDDEATAIVFYSGHGWLDKKTGKYYLIAHDLNYSKVTSSALSSDDFANALRSIKSRRLLVFMDCCHAAGMATAKDSPIPKLPPDYSQEAIPKGLAAKLKQGEGRAVFSSSTSAQQSLIRPDGMLSIFTYHLIEALNGAGNRPEDTVVRISNLMNHLGKTVPESANAACGAKQTPFFNWDTEDFPVALLFGGKGLSPQGLDHPIHENPFKPLNGRIDDPSLVFGRESKINDALEFLKMGSSVVFLGDHGSGRSSLLTLLLDRVSKDLGWKTAHLDLQMIEDEKSFYRALCETLGVAEARGYRLSRSLNGQRILLALDEVERMTFKGFTRNLRSELRGLAGDASAPLKLAMAASTPLDRLFPDSFGNTSPLAGICQQIQVGPWGLPTAREFLQDRLKNTSLTFSEAEIVRLFQESKGMPQQLMHQAFHLYRRKLGQEP
jgi:hypothetical protein